MPQGQYTSERDCQIGHTDRRKLCSLTFGDLLSCVKLTSRHDTRSRLDVLRFSPSSWCFSSHSRSPVTMRSSLSCTYGGSCPSVHRHGRRRRFRRRICSFALSSFLITTLMTDGQLPPVVQLSEEAHRHGNDMAEKHHEEGEKAQIHRARDGSIVARCNLTHERRSERERTQLAPVSVGLF